MKKSSKVSQLLDKVTSFGEKNGPALLTGTAIVGLVVTGVAAYKAGLKAHDILERKKEEMNHVETGDKEAIKAVKKETVKELVPVLAGPIIAGVATAGCMIGSTAAASRKIAIISAAYNFSEKGLKDLNEKMQDMLGEKKTKAIKDAIGKDRLDAIDLPKEGSPVLLMGDGDVLCCDLYTGRYFRSNAQKIGEAINRLSHDVQMEMWVCLNDLYELINSPDLSSVPMGNDFGWDVDDCVRGQVPITFTAQLTSDQKPCLCLDYDAKPRRDMRSLY